MGLLINDKVEILKVCEDGDRCYDPACQSARNKKFKTGTITGIANPIEGTRYHVKFDYGGDCWYSRNELKKVE